VFPLALRAKLPYTPMAKTISAEMEIPARKTNPNGPHIVFSSLNLYGVVLSLCPNSLLCRDDHFCSSSTFDAPQTPTCQTWRCVSSRPRHHLRGLLLPSNEFATSMLSHVPSRKESSILDEKVRFPSVWQYHCLLHKESEFQYCHVSPLLYHKPVLRRFRRLGVMKVFSFHFLFH